MSLKEKYPENKLAPEYFVKKPVRVQALCYKGGLQSEEAARAWLQGSFIKKDGASIIIGTLEGPHRCSPGDWIICGVNGEFYPCKPDVFEKTYDWLPQNYDYDKG